MFCSKQLAYQYGSHHEGVDSNTVLDTRREWEEIQKFGASIYMNHILLCGKCLGPLVYHWETRRI